MKKLVCPLLLVVALGVTSCDVNYGVAQRTQAIYDVTASALSYAHANNGVLPTTEELARYIGEPVESFNYVVVLTGKLDEHQEPVGGMPKILIREKEGGHNGRWAFGYVDGLATNFTAESYAQDGSVQALQLIQQAKSSKGM